MENFRCSVLGAFAAPAILLLLALALTACEQGDRVEITDESTYSEHRRPQKLDVPSAGRFPSKARTAAMASPAGSGADGGFHFHWEKPEGWEELPPTQFRTANFAVGANGEGECYLSMSGGALFDNANRWRGQMGLDSYTKEEFDSLKRFDILGGSALLLRLEGAYSGMGANAQPGFQLLGMMLELNGTGVFVKMVGPAELVKAEERNFISFIGSLQAEGNGAHGGTTVAPAAASGVELPADHPPIGPSAAPGPVAGSVEDAQRGQGYAWKAPESWLRLPNRSMRLVTYRVGEFSEIYVTPLGREAGGELANINRWLGQFEQSAVSQAGLDTMPRVSLLGKEVAFLEVSGTGTDMQGAAIPGQSMLGAAYTSPSGSLFIRMTGPSAEVAAQRDVFVAFCASFTRAP